VLRATPLTAARALATRLELVGFPHHVSVERLAAEIGPEILSRDSLEALGRAAAGLAAEAREGESSRGGMRT